MRAPRCRGRARRVPAAAGAGGGPGPGSGYRLGRCGRNPLLRPLAAPPAPRPPGSLRLAAYDVEGWTWRTPGMPMVALACGGLKWAALSSCSCSTASPWSRFSASLLMNSSAHRAVTLGS